MTSKPALPALPLTLEGWSVLHQMFRVRWSAWRGLEATAQQQVVSEAVGLLGAADAAGESAAYALIGHKGDLMLVHFRPSFDDLKAIELKLSASALGEFLEPAHSYLSVIELGLYDSTVKLYRALAEKGVAEQSDEWKQQVEETMARQREAMRPRLYPKIPPSRYLCFYPMDRKRGEQKNWYTLPIEERQRQMDEHGQVGRRYAGQVQQIITGSIGFDDWEWGVDLFAPEPLVFKKLIYEMRFDRVSAEYALFGSFFVGLRFEVSRLGEYLRGNLPGEKM